MKTLLMLTVACGIGLAGCSKKEEPLKDSYPLTVDYTMSDADLLRDYKEVATLNARMVGTERSTGSENIQIRVVPNSKFDIKSIGSNRYATEKEMLEFIKTYPQIAAKRKGICARGTQFELINDVSQEPSIVWPVVTHGSMLGYWSNCYWVLEVLGPES
jgi:hypothetical protein